MACSFTGLQPLQFLVMGASLKYGVWRATFQMLKRFSSVLMLPLTLIGCRLADMNMFFFLNLFTRQVPLNQIDEQSPKSWNVSVHEITTQK